MSENRYRAWVELTEPSEAELAIDRERGALFAKRPLISLLAVTRDEDEVQLRATLGSLAAQLYERFELIVADGGSQRPHVRSALAASEAAGELRAILPPGPLAGADALNLALDAAEGEFVALIDPGDRLAPDALLRMIEPLQRLEVDVVYSDEDAIDIVGERSAPAFKPYWSPDHLLTRPYLGRLSLFRAELVRSVGGLRPELGAEAEHDLILRVCEAAGEIRHVPRVLYHRLGRQAAEPAGAAAAAEAALARRGEDAEVVAPGRPGAPAHLRRRPSRGSSVAAIVITPPTLQGSAALGALRRRTALRPAEIVIAGESELAPELPHFDSVHPARAANLAAAGTSAGHLLFIDARARPAERTGSGWLTRMLGHAERDHVGAVGCIVERAHGELAHGGAIGDLRRLRPEADGSGADPSAFPLTRELVNAPLVSAECMLISRAAFEEAGGFDEDRLPASLYDIDLCLRLRAEGRFNLHVGEVTMVNPGRPPRPSPAELACIWERWLPELTVIERYANALRTGPDGPEVPDVSQILDAPRDDWAYNPLVTAP